MERIIQKIDIERWLEQLRDFVIYGPAAGAGTEESYRSFRRIGEPGELDLEYLNTPRSPKDKIFPQRETLLKYLETGDESPGIDVEEVMPPDEKQILLGIRPCDAHAVSLMDEVFMGESIDLYYKRRRDATTLVGLGCTNPSYDCFCTSVNGSPHDSEGLDILMTDMGDTYFLDSQTDKGTDLMDVPGDFFRKPSNEERNKLHKIHDYAHSNVPRHIDSPSETSAKLSQNNVFESDLWERESMACIRCGICTYQCPSCHCFDISDEVHSAAPLQGSRVRNWDNCQFPDFTMHSSGHNPRPGKASRLRRRVLHKFRYFVDNHNQYLCTGCGRCISQCPVGIDIVAILNRIAAGNHINTQTMNQIRVEL